MALNIDDLISGIRLSRKHFLMHLKGLREDQWDWKPYPECKSIRETIAHLISDDEASYFVFSTGREPDYGNIQVVEQDMDKLMVMLDESHNKLCEMLKDKFADTPLDVEVPFFMGRMKLALAISAISSEDYYHTGQIAYIRMATDPGWDYYRSIYGF